MWPIRILLFRAQKLVDLGTPDPKESVLTHIWNLKSLLPKLWDLPSLKGIIKLLQLMSITNWAIFPVLGILWSKLCYGRSIVAWNDEKRNLQGKRKEPILLKYRKMMYYSFIKRFHKSTSSLQVEIRQMGNLIFNKTVVNQHLYITNISVRSVMPTHISNECSKYQNFNHTY